MSTPAAFDIVIIGAGPAGQKAAIQGAKAGKRVALLERERGIGGSCVYRGTIPSKTLREVALAIAGVKARQLIGVDVSVRRQAKIEDLLRHERAVKASEAHQMRTLLDRYGVTVIQGDGRFADPHTVRVTRPTPPGGELDLKAEKVVINPGDVLVMFSDGVTEARSMSDEEYGEDWWFQVWGPEEFAEEGIGSRDDWMINGKDQWHGFGKIASGFNMLDPIKATIVTPGLSLDGQFSDTGIPVEQ